MVFEFLSPCLAHRDPFSDPSAQGMEKGATGIEDQQKAKSKGGRMCGDLLRGEGCYGSVGRPHTPGDELSLHFAGSGKTSGFRFVGFLLTLPPGAVLGSVRLTEV